MPKVLTIEHPRYVTIPRKTKEDKKIPINLNTYRNLHYQENNTCKQIARENIRKYLEYTNQEDIKFDGCVSVTFKVYKKTKARLDKSNVFSVATKYFYDALVTLGYLVEDNDDIIKEELLLPTEIDKENPRIVMTITDYGGNE